MGLEPIPDHLEKGLRLLFIGFNPSVRSAETGHHYANRNNRFWNILYQAGITERKFEPCEDQDLLQRGIGFTNIVARPTKAAADITKEEYIEGAQLLRDKLQYYRPKVACFVGKGVFQQYSKVKQTGWGVQASSVTQHVTEFVAPSSSGLVRMPMKEIVEIYAEIPAILKELEEKR
ncbi:TDG/mug DNA glycosylase family protein [Terribacillus halophilus]|uniref:TDG/mug DNA glycosylase family protein n=1 Tax=Terribacillus halophilus TaxID=361279 RepID=A0A1G6P8X6_9BACI|nr:mismatch-specific DNA-glycosylase [Terribacillus halophilus]SDC76064.1 TDG/mug DNA glycosylase family protein [Terribacillus halophilus]